MKKRILCSYIAIVGPNGSGKSTTIKQLEKILKAKKIKVKTYYEGRYNLQFLPINFLKRFFKPSKIERGKNHNKGTKREHMREVRIYDSKLIRATLPFIYYIEFLLRYLFKIIPARLKYDIILTERSFIDLFTSPNTNKTICKALFTILPKPKHILLWNEPETLIKRRPEFQLRHVKEQLDIYNQFSSIYLTKVKTDKKEIVKNIEKEISVLI